MMTEAASVEPTPMMHDKAVPNTQTKLMKERSPETITMTDANQHEVEPPQNKGALMGNAYISSQQRQQVR